MRKLQCVMVAGAVLAGPVAVATASQVGATPGPTREPVKAHANTTLLAARALGGLAGGHGALDVDLAVAHSTADSAAAPNARSTAHAANFTVGVGGQDLLRPTEVSQHALPDNPHPTTRSLDLTHTPLAPVVQARLLSGSAQARWGAQNGPCVGNPLSHGVSTVADLSVLNAGLLDGLSQATGLPAGFGRKSLVALPGTAQSVSDISLRSVPGQRGKAVVSMSNLQVANLTLFAGSPSQIEVRVVSRPTLTAVSTGSAATSTVTYTAPVLDIRQGDRSIGRLDASHPTLDAPVAAGLPRQLDLGLVRLSLGEFQQSRNGAEVSGKAALLDVRVLPRTRGAGLVHVVVGEQEVGALAPSGGIECTTPVAPVTGAPSPVAAPSAAPVAPAPAPSPGRLAETNASYNPVPFILFGGLLLLVGSVLVAAVPRLRRSGGGAAGS